MDKQKAKVLCDLLRSTSTEKVIKGLREIKKRLLTYNENLIVFRQLGLLPQTLKLIQRPNEDILNGALSVLSASCTDDAARIEVFNVGGVPHLLNVLKCAKSEALQLRSCRTMANQAQHKPSCEGFVKLKALDLIIEMLSNCNEDETKLQGIRALRLFANCGGNCQKIVMSKGIHHICKAGFSSGTTTPVSGLLRGTIKAISHFSRISHPECVSQIMDGTDNMMVVTKMWNCGDAEMHECVVHVMVNLVATCFELSVHRRDNLDARVLDRLCTANGPTIIVSELKNRKVPAIDEEKLILALCKFCEGSNECNNLTAGSFSEPPTFLGRAWMQLIECGGVALLVSLLRNHRHNSKLRPAILKAMLGVEHNYSYRDTILKHFLAAKLLPQLAEQFDELMGKYMEVRRESVPGCCVHFIKQDKSSVHEGVEDEERKDLEARIGKQNRDKKQANNITGEGMEDEEKKDVEGSNAKQKVDGEEMDADDNIKNDSCERDKSKSGEDNNHLHNLSSASSSHMPQTSCKSLPQVTPSPVMGELSGPQTNMNIQTESKPSQLVVQDFAKGLVAIYPPNSPESPVSAPGYYDPRSPSGSVSCSPHSFQSGSGYGSPTWSPALEHSPSPGSSPPYNSNSSSISTNPLSILLPLNVDPLASSASSPYGSPPHSPIMCPHSPGIPSPPRSTSPIRVPSDWEYEDEEDKEQWDEDGRFSPPITNLKGNDGEENMEETEEEEEVLTEEEEEEMNRTEGESGGLEESEKGFVKEMDEKLIMKDSSECLPSGPEKRPLSVSSPSTSGTISPQEKKIKLDVESVQGSSQEKSFTKSSSERGYVKEHYVVSLACDTRKTPFKEINKIKFRLGNPAKRQLSRCIENKDVYSPLQGLQTDAGNDHQRQQEARQLRRRSSSTCSTSAYSDLTSSEARELALLELVVRAIGQVAYVKEAIKPVCREFVPRIMTYLSRAQVINKAATRMLVTIARNPLCIQPLLDSNFIPYVGVELGEAGNPESPSGCPQCSILCEGSAAFLVEMVKFFNHIHQYGQCEMSRRLQPLQDPLVREGCVMALPHVTRCPKLLHDFLVSYPAIEVLMKVLRSDLPPSNARYMYATAAISRLATMLQLENQFKPVKCEVCLKRGTHTKEEISAQLNNQRLFGQKKDPRQGGLVFAQLQQTPPQPPHRRPVQSRECKFACDKNKDITFKLKDGSCVSANREFLAEQNEVLSNMLMGSFSEGNSSCIELAWTCKASVEELMHFLYKCECNVMGRGDTKAYIELMFMSQMYLMDDLHAYAVHNLIPSISGGDDIISIYESEVGRIDEHIILQALCNALVKPMKTWKRAIWLKELFQSRHAEDIDHNIRMIIHHPLDMNRQVCNCDQSLSLYRVSESDYRKLC
ncbi:hypothetical protein Pcinc_011101 [Petrolisthes cinctipes]|uniref:BTB domain-containing protein n=1 Tax=Petrolisthes cinctipes TaxID=88211 RepID=A0AAE1G3F4_PETCI|nr:hypothetical protein Pcinc_011101 [Petrolisthes cinctipes]